MSEPVKTRGIFRANKQAMLLMAGHPLLSISRNPKGDLVLEFPDDNDTRLDLHLYGELIKTLIAMEEGRLPEDPRYLETVLASAERNASMQSAPVVRPAPRQPGVANPAYPPSRRKRAVR